MDKKTRNRLIIIGAIELAIVAFCLTISIWVIATIQPPTNPNRAADNLRLNGEFIGWFQNHSVEFFLIIVLPLFLLLALDVTYLIIYATKRESALSASEQEAIREQARREAREEVMRELQQEGQDKPQE